LLASLAGGLVACSSGTTSSGTSATEPVSGEEQAGLVKTYCDARQKRTASCADPAEAVKDDARCRTERCLSSLLTAQSINDISACLAAQVCTPSGQGYCTCAESDDVCFAKVGASVPPSPSLDAYQTACRRKLDECGKGTSSFSDDWCTPGDIPFQSFRPAVLDGFVPCFSQACGNDTISTCLRTKMNELSGGACEKE